MTISIGIITARNSLENIQALDSEMQKFGKISYLPYRTMPELCSLYTKNLRKFDGILFSGPIPRDYVIENIGPIVIPCRCIDLKDRDYYLTIARLYANNPGLDITRVYFDMIIDPYIFKNIFPEGTGPRFPTNFSSPQYRNLLRSSVYESSLNSYRDLWKNGTFDIFVTRYTNLTSRLHAEKIPHILLKPTPETILDCFHSLLGDVHTYFLHNALTACCIIEAEETESMSEHHRRMEKVLEEFRNSHNNDMLIRKNGLRFELSMSIAKAKEITLGYTSCNISDELRKKLSFPFFIGWGVGFDVMGAYRNAKRALLASRKKNSNSAFLLTETQEMIGPLDSNRSVSYNLLPNAYLASMAKSMGIAPLNLEKLFSLQRTRDMYEFTSSDLVYLLEITPRSASRILQKLTDAGFAQPIRNVSLSGTGRPTTVYEINFNKLMP